MPLLTKHVRKNCYVLELSEANCHAKLRSLKQLLNKCLRFPTKLLRFLTSHRWTVYVTPNFRKGWHNYRTASMQCHACHQHTSIQPILLMLTGPELLQQRVAQNAILLLCQ